MHVGKKESSAIIHLEHDFVDSVSIEIACPFNGQIVNEEVVQKTSLTVERATTHRGFLTIEEKTTILLSLQYQGIVVNTCYAGTAAATMVGVIDLQLQFGLASNRIPDLLTHILRGSSYKTSAGFIGKDKL